MIASDATYRLNWMGYPVFVIGNNLICIFFIIFLKFPSLSGAVSSLGKFRLGMIVVSSHEDKDAQIPILKYLRDLGVNPKFFMGK